MSSRRRCKVDELSKSEGFKMADLTGTEIVEEAKKNANRPTPTPPPLRCANGMQKRAPKEEGRELVPVLCHLDAKNACQDSKKK